MNTIKYIILGIIQGLTEPLPISSSGHIILFKAIFNTTIFNSLNFEILTNFGSFLAIFLIFWKDISHIIKHAFIEIFHPRKGNSTNLQLCYKIIISTIPVGIAGLLFKDSIENINNIYYLALAFLFTSGLLFIVKNKNGQKNTQDITWVDAIIIGLFQAVTIMPGISRSGTVLVATLLCNINRKDAIKYTFLLYFPVSIATFGLGIRDFIFTPNLNAMLIPYMLGTISAFLITYVSYKWMARLVTEGKLMYFAIYCILISTFIIVYFH